MDLAIGIDIGGTKTKIGLVGHHHASKRTCETNDKQTFIANKIKLIGQKS